MRARESGRNNWLHDRSKKAIQIKLNTCVNYIPTIKQLSVIYYFFPALLLSYPRDIRENY